MPALAQDRRETLLVVTEVGPNSMDIHGVGANRPSYGLSWNVYDRLLTYGKKTLPDGTATYDYSVLEPELATQLADRPGRHVGDVYAPRQTRNSTMARRLPPTM